MSRYLFWFVLEPSSLIAAGIILGAFLSRAEFGRKLLWWSAMALFAFGVVPIGGLLLAPLEQRFPAPKLERVVDGIIVLAGAELPGLSAYYGHPQFDGYTDRLTTFLMLANRFPAAKLLHSGGGVEKAGSQSDVARDLILGVGMPAERVQFEGSSRDTCESGRLSYDQMRPSSSATWLLVTSAAHMPRAVACFRAAGWRVLPYPTDYKQGPSFASFWLFDNLSKLNLATHEWLGLAYYRLTGLTAEFFPAPDR